MAAPAPKSNAPRPGLLTLRDEGLRSPHRLVPEVSNLIDRHHLCPLRLYGERNDGRMLHRCMENMVPILSSATTRLYHCQKRVKNFGRHL